MRARKGKLGLVSYRPRLAFQRETLPARELPRDIAQAHLHKEV